MNHFHWNKMTKMKKFFWGVDRPAMHVLHHQVSCSPLKIVLLLQEKT